MKGEIINRVAESDLITLNLEDYYAREERVFIDISNNLYEGMALREKDFREYIEKEDWSGYSNRIVGIYCSVDAIIPTWAYMLLSVKLAPYAKRVIYGDGEKVEEILFHDAIQNIKPEAFHDKKIVIKGCGHIRIPESAFVQLTTLLQPYVKSIMYGEPCSTVPIYKRPKKG